VSKNNRRKLKNMQFNLSHIADYEINPIWDTVAFVSQRSTSEHDKFYLNYANWYLRGQNR